MLHLVGVTGGDRFPGVPAGVGCRNTERGQQPVLAVGAVVGQRLAGPLGRGQDAAPGIAEVFAAVGLAFAGPGDQAGPGIFGLDAVAEPVGAPRRARSEPQRLGQPVGVFPLGIGLGVVAVRWRLATARLDRKVSPDAEPLQECPPECAEA